MIRKCLIYFLSLIMIIGLFGGCGKKSSPAKSEVSVVPDEIERVEQSEEMKSEGVIWPDVTPYMTTLPTGVENAAIFVEPIEGLSEDFIKGMDVSSILALEESGVTFYNKAGNPQDVFQVLADAGVNYIRVRVWNEPYDAEGNGYGGGNCDAVTAAIIGRRAAACGMKLLVDFHYSDFWADASKQEAPKDWENITYWDKIDAIYDYTKESLELILSAGADVGMVQIGNEVNNGFAGEISWDYKLPLMKAAGLAVRDVEKSEGKKIQIAVHLADVDDTDQMLQIAEILQNTEFDYDVFGVSYYPYEHGPMENLTATLTQIHEKYDKKTAVLETAYAYTLDNGDVFYNLFNADDVLPDYGATVQSQATCIRDIMAATAAAGDSALGVFYWEGAWIPVGTDKETNAALWEEYGSGWATSYAAEYAPQDAGVYYGGCYWENQAMFDMTGHPLASLDVFKYVNYGTGCEAAVDFVETKTVYLHEREVLELPREVHVVYNDRSLSTEEPVIWNEADYKDIKTDAAGEYIVGGVLADGSKVTCKVIIEE